MKKLLFLGTILLCASNTFAIELEKEKKTEKTDKIVLMCVVRNAIDQDGEVLPLYRVAKHLHLRQQE